MKGVYIISIETAKKHSHWDNALKRAKERRDQDDAPYSIWFDGEACYVRAYSAVGPRKAMRVHTEWPEEKG